MLKEVLQAEKNNMKNLDQHKGIESAKNDKYLVKYFSQILSLKKIND